MDIIQELREKYIQKLNEAKKTSKYTNLINVEKKDKTSKGTKKTITDKKISKIKTTNYMNKENRYSLTAGQKKIIPSNRYSTGKLNRVNMVNSVSGPFDLTNFNKSK